MFIVQHFVCSLPLSKETMAISIVEMTVFFGIGLKFVQICTQQCCYNTVCQCVAIIRCAIVDAQVQMLFSL